MSEPKRIWVVEQGEYSDYRVVGVFSSRENAERVAALVTRPSNEASVAEWDLDPAIEDLNAGHTRWHVSMTADGRVLRCEPHHDGEFGSISIVASDVEVAGPASERYVWATVWATDEAHAVKIDNEHRARFIADGKL